MLHASSTATPRTSRASGWALPVPRPLAPEVVAAISFAIDRCVAKRGHTLARPANDDGVALGRYWADAARVVGDDLALAVAADLPIGALGLASYAIVSLQTVGEALDVLSRVYLERMVPGMRLRIVPLPHDRVELRLLSDLDAPEMQLLEELVLAVLHRHLALAARPVAVSSVGFRRSAPPVPATAWRTCFGVTPRFGQRYTCLRLATANLALELRTASRELQALVRGSSDVVADESFAARVRTYIRGHLRELLETDTIARELAVSARTLQRRLHDEQTSLRELVTVVRLEVARDMLEHTELTIAAIATAVGFSQAASLSRAFTSAYGESPLAYRNRIDGR